jgi:hypothetical protein
MPDHRVLTGADPRVSVISASWTGSDEALLAINETILVIWRTHPETIARHNTPSLNQGDLHQDQW